MVVKEVQSETVEQSFGVRMRWKMMMATPEMIVIPSIVGKGNLSLRWIPSSQRGFYLLDKRRYTKTLALTMNDSKSNYDG